MVSALDPLTGDVCNEGFVQIIDKKAENKNEAEENKVDEEKRRANEQYRIVFDRNNQTHNRVNIYDRSTDNINGSPEERKEQKNRA